MNKITYPISCFYVSQQGEIQQKLFCDPPRFIDDGHELDEENGFFYVMECGFVTKYYLSPHKAISQAIINTENLITRATAQLKHLKNYGI